MSQHLEQCDSLGRGPEANVDMKTWEGYPQPSIPYHGVHFSGDIHCDLSVFPSWGGCHGRHCNDWCEGFTAQ
jgi:hypothetical protein